MWAQLLSACIGIWFMIFPGVFNLTKPLADNYHIGGPIIAALGIIASWQVTRSVRLWKFPFAVWFVLIPWIFNGSTIYVANSLIFGTTLIFLCLFKGEITRKTGGGWSALLQ